MIAARPNALVRQVVSPVLMLALALVLVMAANAARAAERDRLVAFLNVTGFDVALDSIALSAAKAPGMLGLSASDFGEQWSRIAEDVFGTGKMRTMALDILEETLSDEDLAHAAAFYATPLGQRLVEVENASHMVGEEIDKRAIGEELIARMVETGSPRAGLLSDLNAAVDSGDVAVRAVQELQLRFMMAASNAGVLERRIDEGRLRALMRENRDSLRLDLKRSGLAAAAYTYRDISDEDLRDYLEALRDPQMQRVYELMNAVQWEVTADRYEALAKRMAEVGTGQEL
ncbi:uncharacterized protein DUF2059 [Roseovarius halotolerans]|uniref:DUF2059 domain-containing protein n=1 Tax=Roseovarius halotolerans TaxID=505353 RepID=A0A1X6YNK0_9RHOB|nr:DUF2059 domain-containing protein [Roseovarius halotolerans]RKT34152.1 uncharacterized protein DUF2059 [Roseovarius halotolerans]SLN26559.1 hypothetical protein ROH8110_01236 [Roseovarius halotolerans]